MHSYHVCYYVTLIILRCYFTFYVIYCPRLRLYGFATTCAHYVAFVACHGLVGFTRFFFALAFPRYPLPRSPVVPRLLIYHTVVRWGSLPVCTYHAPLPAHCYHRTPHTPHLRFHFTTAFMAFTLPTPAIYLPPHRILPAVHAFYHTTFARLCHLRIATITTTHYLHRDLPRYHPHAPPITPTVYLYTHHHLPFPIVAIPVVPRSFVRSIPTDPNLIILITYVCCCCWIDYSRVPDSDSDLLFILLVCLRSFLCVFVVDFPFLIVIPRCLVCALSRTRLPFVNVVYLRSFDSFFVVVIRAVSF